MSSTTSPGGSLRRPTGPPEAMFVFFSNRLGCLPSLLLSAVVTVLLILLLRS
jgi:hypothetical protein